MNKRKIILLSIFIICFLIGILLLIFNGNSIFKKHSFSYKKITAKEIKSKYKNISFNSSTLLKNGETIKTEGSYDLQGEYECITIDTKYNVELNLKDANIICEDGPALYIKNANLVKMNIIGNNTISSTTTENFDGAIYSKEDLYFSGEGSLLINSNYDGIVSKDSILIESGRYEITSQDDAIRGKDSVAIMNGTFILNASKGIKTNNDLEKGKGFIVIDNGNFTIKSEKDGIQAETDLIINNGEYNIHTSGDANLGSTKGLKAGNLIQITDGNFEIVSMDDAIYSDGNIGLYGGSITVKSDSDAIDANRIILIKDGTYDFNSNRGLVATYIKMDNGTIHLFAYEAGIRVNNRSGDNDMALEVNGGELNINMKPGETYGIHSDGNIYLNKGTLSVKAKNPFYYGGKTKYKGGKLIVNEKELTEFQNELMSVEELRERQPSPPPQQQPQQPQK